MEIGNEELLKLIVQGVVNGICAKEGIKEGRLKADVRLDAADMTESSTGKSEILPASYEQILSEIKSLRENVDGSLQDFGKNMANLREEMKNHREKVDGSLQDFGKNMTNLSKDMANLREEMSNHREEMSNHRENVNGSLRDFRRKMTDFETTQYGNRTLARSGGYRPESEYLDVALDASIQPISAWRRKPG